ncbi:MAG: uracil-DNA glycosylase [Deltaproteobacteria bacterium]|nr:uracil-DNA glycosylase [Deltaproteobacteria bacterium]
MKAPKRIDCHKCRHYYVTWDKRFPHGCRAMKFKSKVLPSATVMDSSKRPCMLYGAKPQKQASTDQK